MSVTLPDGITAKVELPASEGSTGVTVNGEHAEAQQVGSRWILAEDISGTVKIECVKK